MRSILGRFLEHSRVVHFQAQDEYWIGSADMMHRNLDRRVEVMAQVKDPKLRERLAVVFDSALDPRHPLLGAAAGRQLGRPAQPGCRQPRRAGP